MISEAKIENFNHNPLPFRRAFSPPEKTQVHSSVNASAFQVKCKGV